MYISELSWGSRSHVQFMVLLKHKHKDAYIYTVQRYQVPMKHMGICACQGSHEAQGSCAYRKCNAYTGQCFALWKTPDTAKIYQITTEYVCEPYQLLWRLSSLRLTNSHTVNWRILHARILCSFHSVCIYQTCSVCAIQHNALHLARILNLLALSFLLYRIVKA